MRSELASKALEDGTISSFSISVGSGGYKASVQTADGEDLTGSGASPDAAYSDALDSESNAPQGDPAPAPSAPRPQQVPPQAKKD